MKRLLIIFILLSLISPLTAADVTRYVDPRIGSEGLGRTYIGPCMPYGMIKPSPDAVSMPNSGWAPMPEPIKGFSQVHVSGTGGGQKYGNILIMPFVGKATTPWLHSVLRKDETIKLGYYSTTLADDIKVEITTADKSAIYRIEYPRGSRAGLSIDAGAFLGMSDVPDQRETQQLVGSQIEVVSDYEVKGYNRVRGGWNNGRAYTVYFYAISDRPFSKVETWKGHNISDQTWQSDTHQYTGAILQYAPETENVTLRIGISYLSELRAKENLMTEIPNDDFESVYARCTEQWNHKLSRIAVAENTPDNLKRMLYTGIYHTMLMPTDRSGENPLWADDSPYYDDYYAIWDTYRTSMPLLTLIDTDRQIDMVNSLINIYRRDGYMPDSRSGNANGRTQGGSNAEIAIADAMAKGLGGIDYEMALEAMLKDADVPPGGNEEAEGRGGLVEYMTLGYVPHGIPRCGNRTVEYAYCDYAIAQVAKALGRDDVYERMMGRSTNWKNLWRDDYEHTGVRGFIMPRAASGEWLDSLSQGHSDKYAPKYEYTAMTFEGPWYTPWWSMVFYEAPSWEYSLSIPHDVPGLIEKCGGAEAFEHRLDTFFDRGYYNVNNEPSFLSPCLYHWIGKPWRSSDRVREIVDSNFSDTPMGLPGNDDSGAMSSWLTFHLIGLYPNAGQDYYLINTPLMESATLHMPNGADFTISTENFGGNNRYIASATLNGTQYPYSSLHHSDIVKGGELHLTLTDKPTGWGTELAPAVEIPPYDLPQRWTDLQLSADAGDAGDEMLFVFKLHGQTRRYRMKFDELPDGEIKLTWGIERNLKWPQGSYTTSAAALEHGSLLDLSMPIDGADIVLDDSTTSYVISRDAYRRLLSEGTCDYNHLTYTLERRADGMLYLRDHHSGSEMWVLDNEHLPIIWAMQGNPLEVNWIVSP